MSKSTGIDPQILDRLVAKIVNTVQPRRIILSGSAAHRQMGPHSDVDLLVVMPDGVHRRQTAQHLYRALTGLGIAKDIVVVTESGVRQFSDEPSLVICPALREGKELFHSSR
jgi:predicted nucleotidyltransferase